MSFTSPSGANDSTVRLRDGRSYHRPSRTSNDTSNLTTFNTLVSPPHPTGNQANHSPDAQVPPTNPPPGYTSPPLVLQGRQHRRQNPMTAPPFGSIPHSNDMQQQISTLRDQLVRNQQLHDQRIAQIQRDNEARLEALIQTIGNQVRHAPTPASSVLDPDLSLDDDIESNLSRQSPQAPMPPPNYPPPPTPPPPIQQGPLPQPPPVHPPQAPQVPLPAMPPPPPTGQPPRPHPINAGRPLPQVPQPPLAAIQVPYQVPLPPTPQAPAPIPLFGHHPYQAPPIHGTFPAPPPTGPPGTFAYTPNQAQLINAALHAIADKKHDKLTLPPLKKGTRDAYSPWRRKLLTTLRAHSKFKRYVHFNIQHGLHITPAMDQEDKDALYIALVKSVDDSILIEVGIDDYADTDGLELLRRLETEYGLIVTSHSERMRLTNSLHTLTKDPKESFSQYHRRFRHAVQVCQTNNLMPFTTRHELYLLYLSNSREVAFKSVLLAITNNSSDATDWIACPNLESLRKRAIDFLKNYRDVYQSSPLKKPSKEKSSPSSTTFDDRAKRLNAYVSSHTDAEVTSHLRNQISFKKGGCYLHDMDSHEYSACSKVKKILSNHNKTHCLAKALKPPTSSSSSKSTSSTTPTAKRASIAKQQAALDRRARRVARKEKEANDLVAALRASVGLPAPTSTLTQQFDQAAADESSDDGDIEYDSSSESEDSTDEVDTSNSTNHNNSIESYSMSSPIVRRSVSVRFTLPPLATCKRSSLPSSTDDRLIVDSGCTHHMEINRQDFDYITPITTDTGSLHHVQLGDNSTLPILGIGPVRKRLATGHTIRYTAYYVPGLSCSLYSVMQHSSIKGCYFHSEQSSATLAFPTFLIPLHTFPELTLPLSSSSIPSQPAFDSTTSLPVKPLHSTKVRLVTPSHIHPDFTPAQQDRFTTSLTVQSSSPLSAPSIQSPSPHHGIHSLDTITLPPKSTAPVRTGLTFTLPPRVQAIIHPLPSSQFKTSSHTMDHTSNCSPPLLSIHNPTDTHLTIPKGSLLSRIRYTINSAPKVILSTHRSPSAPPKPSIPSTSSPSRRFQVFHTSNGPIFVDHKRARKPRARRMNRPLSSGVRQPRPTTPLPPESLWTSQSLQDDEAVAENPALQQTLPSLDPKNAHEKHPPHITPNPTERTNSSTHKHVKMSVDDLRQSIGFLQPDRLLRHLDILGDGTFSVSHLPRNPVLDPGETASINATKRNTTPSSPPAKFNDTWHMDIGYGPCTAHGGIKYTLLFVDKATRYKRIYPLKNLTTSLLRAVKRFFKDCKHSPRLIRTDFDKKLLHGDVATYIEETKGVDLQAAPPRRQHQNGLVERAWQTAVTMTRNWLTSSLLPAKYWWFGMKRAVEIMNILPTSHIKHRHTTPHELVYQTKANYRTLFPMFSIAYLKQDREQGGSHKNKWRTRSLKCIVVGTDPKSDGLQFYHPPSKQLLTGHNGFRLDPQLPSGPQFREIYDGSFVFNTRSDLDRIHRPLTHEENATVYFRDPSNPTVYIPSTVLSAPVNDSSEPYTIQEKATGNIHEYMASDLLDTDPTSTPTDDPTTSVPFPLFPWIVPDAKSTLYLPQTMSKPKQGFLRRDDTGSWSFHPGRLGNKKPINLHNFSELAPSMVSNKKLFQGWKTSNTVLTARHIRATSNIIARHVSAASLKVQEAPSLLRHHLLHPHDRKLWDAAYQEEIDGLLNLKTWEVISEDEYKCLRSVTGKALPTMAISKIKKDEHGNPQRCKYRIVVLGNLDSHNWDKSDCFAPVLSQAEMRLLVSNAVRLKRVPKCGDVSQAFCQGVLPPSEQYVIRPPPGCPYTPKNSYWKLLRTLYGLKRSPRHWYDKAKKILESIGLKRVKNSSCIFHGTVIPGHPPLYVGLYVDDFIYYSESDLVEKTFETKFGSKVKTTFDGDVTHFLGIAFHSTRHADGHVSIHLSQEAFTDSLLQRTRLDSDDVAPAPSPYRSGLPIDKLPTESHDPATQDKLNHRLQQITGSLQWLATSTRPDIATVTNLLAQHNHRATKGHLAAAKRVIRYLKGTKRLGICFHSRRNSRLQSFVKFPIGPNTITPFTDANWGPQDQSKPKPHDPPVELFKSRSISGFILWLNGPVHWSSRRQTITARSTAEAEIYATDECVKFLQFFYNLLEEMNLHHVLMPRPSVIYNDNAACVAWSHSLSTKGLRHIQIRENAIREQVQLKHFIIRHIQGALNLSDLFTKEDKDITHFIRIRDFLLEPITR